MLTVKKFNKISDVIYTQMAADKYNFVEDGDNYDVALVRSAELHDTVFPAELLAIARAGAGTNNIPINRCTEQGVVVFNTPGANANAVKELVICGMLLACRRIVPGMKWLDKQHAEGATGVDKTMEKAKKDFVGQEIMGKTLGVMGLGAIGILVANAAIALGMNVIGYDPFLNVNAALKLDPAVKLAQDPKDIYAAADFITLHLPQNDATKGMINAAVIDTMKPGAVLLNFARGGLVRDDDVIAALENGKLGRYVTDFPDDKLLGTENLIALPHLGASTPEAEENCAFMAAAQLEEYINNGNIINSVNLPNCSVARPTGTKRAAAIVKGDGAAALQALNGAQQTYTGTRGGYAYVMADFADGAQAAAEVLKGIDGVLRVRVIG